MIQTSKIGIILLLCPTIFYLWAVFFEKNTKKKGRHYNTNFLFVCLCVFNVIFFFENWIQLLFEFSCKKRKKTHTKAVVTTSVCLNQQNTNTQMWSRAKSWAALTVRRSQHTTYRVWLNLKIFEIEMFVFFFVRNFFG